MRTVWEGDSHLSGGNRFFLGAEHFILAQLQKQLGTGSMKTRGGMRSLIHLPDTDENVLV